MEILKSLGELFIKEKINLSIEISQGLDKRYTSFLKDSRLEDDAVVQWRAQLLGFIGNAMISTDEDYNREQVTAWAIQTAEGAVTYGVEINELIATIKVYRKVIWDCIKANVHQETLKMDTFLKMNEIIDSILDHTSHIFSTSYVSYHKRSLKLAHEAMLEISTPVVSLSNDVAILPLVGELDTYRAKVLLESSLARCSELGNTDLIIDLSGVPIVDTMVANELFQLANALKLIGVEPTFTGLRPEIAQAMITLGLDFTDIRTAGSLKKALSTVGIKII